MPRYARCTLSGTLAGGAEAWSTSVAFTDPDQIAPFESSTAQEWAQAIEDALPTIVLGSLQDALSSVSTISLINTYLHDDIGEPAQYAGVATATFTGAGNPEHPTQIAIVASLRTSLATRRGRGRMYWPAVGTAVQSNGRVIGTTVSSLNSEFRTMISGIAAAWPETGELIPVVVSSVGGVLTPVNRIQVGDVLDTQRRRRDTLPENYSSLPYPA